MNNFLIRWLRFGGLAIGLLALAGCRQPESKVVHEVIPAGEGHRLRCQLCYDETVRVLTGSPKHRRYKYIQRHRCEECKTDVAFYEGGDGKVMIRCVRCAPAGQPCDRCLPPIPAASPEAPATGGNRGRASE